MKSKKQKLSRLLPPITLSVLLAAAFSYVYFFGLPIQSRSFSQQYASVSAETGTLEVFVHGTGTIQPTSSTTVYSKTTGTVKKLWVEQDDIVSKGQLIMMLENESLNEQIKTLEKQLKNLDIELGSMPNIKGTATVAAPTDGRLKDLRFDKGDDVMHVVGKYGYLCVLSLDGCMRVVFSPSKPVAAGETVSVTVMENLDDNSGKTLEEGFVAEVDSISGMATVIIKNDMYTIDTTAVVSDSSGTELGRGPLRVNRPLPITAQSGSIKTTNAKENKAFAKGNTLFTLEGDIVTSAFDLKLAEREQAQEDLDKALSDLSGLIIRSTGDGIITDLSLQEGSSVQKDQAVCGVQSADSFKLVVAVDELDISMVALEQSAVISVDALPNVTFDGKVIKVSSRGVSSGGVTAYDVTLEVSQPTGILAGMSASVDIQIAKRENALLIPVEALQTIQNEKYVLDSSIIELTQALAEEEDRRRRFPLDNLFNKSDNLSDLSNDSLEIPLIHVVIGLANDTYVEIVSGLSAGDKIAIPASSSDSGAFTMFGNNRSGTGIAFPR